MARSTLWRGTVSCIVLASLVMVVYYSTSSRSASFTYTVSSVDGAKYRELVPLNKHTTRDAESVTSSTMAAIIASNDVEVNKGDTTTKIASAPEVNKGDTTTKIASAPEVNKSDTTTKIASTPEVNKGDTTTTKHKNMDNNHEENDKLTRGVPTVEQFSCPESIGANLSCQYYKPDWKNQIDIGDLLDQRMAKVRNICTKYRSNMANTPPYNYDVNSRFMQWVQNKKLLVNDNLKLGFCWMPKMGSTFWKRAWKPINFASNKNSKSGRKGTGYRFVSEFFRKHVSKDLYLYIPFSITRSPWDRLVSVYREKCDKNKGNKCQLRFGDKCGVALTFESFLRCVTDWWSKGKTEFFGHVDMSYKRCGICNYPYKYIVSMENMASEMEFILKEVGVTNPLKVMEEVRNHTIRDVEKSNNHISYTDFWTKIPKQLIDKVRFYYRYEIYLYGYPETPFYLEPKSQHSPPIDR